MYKEDDDVYSKPVRAGKRTYFFDVKSTRGGDDFYLTITESKRRNNPDGSFTYDKHKIFLYKEDFGKFSEGLNEVLEYIKDKCFHGEIPVREEEEEEKSIEFEEL
ncbi:MAG: PUR family DNA/RNA-binding protein [Bacteroidales bacterium]|nr:PUR family DNA/RNA-binding protein [Bacteroidales bacterium]